ncbi:MAG: hypothetical protein ACK5LC_06015 [Coprobacillaceae bacterium]
MESKMSLHKFCKFIYTNYSENLLSEIRFTIGTKAPDNYFHLLSYGLDSLTLNDFANWTKNHNNKYDFNYFFIDDTKSRKYPTYIILVSRK